MTSNDFLTSSISLPDESPELEERQERRSNDDVS